MLGRMVLLLLALALEGVQHFLGFVFESRHVCANSSSVGEGEREKISSERC